MRWFLGITALAAVVVGGVAGGGMLLPVKVEARREIVIARPAATVYALVANLRAFPEYSPWRTIDPEIRYEAEGPPVGVGQKLVWTSRNPQIGSGAVETVAVKPLAQVEQSVAAAGKMPMTAIYQLSPEEGGVRVAWIVRSSCPTEIKAILCRYETFLGRAAAGRDLELGLQRLQRLADTLPDVDFADLSVDFVKAESQPFAYVEVESDNEPTMVSAAMRQSLGLVSQFFTLTGLSPAGPAIVFTTHADERWTFQAGYPYNGPAAVGTMQVRVGLTPSGAAVRALHTGGVGTMGDTYEKLNAFLEAHRLEVSAGPWEVYRNASEGEPGTIEVWVLVD